MVWLGTGLNTFGSKVLPTYSRLNCNETDTHGHDIYILTVCALELVILSCLIMTVTTITLFVCSRDNHPPAEWTFGDATNSTGWSSDGLAFLLATSNAVYSFLGTDCGAHMCEEIPAPAKNTPKTIMFPVLIGLVTAWPFTCACMNAITDVEAVLNTPSGLPLIEIYYQSTGSKVASSVLLALFAFCFFGCFVANGRLLFFSFP